VKERFWHEYKSGDFVSLLISKSSLPDHRRYFLSERKKNNCILHVTCHANSRTITEWKSFFFASMSLEQNTCEKKSFQEFLLFVHDLESRSLCKIKVVLHRFVVSGWCLLVLPKRHRHHQCVLQTLEQKEPLEKQLLLSSLQKETVLPSFVNHSWGNGKQWKV
jgi:hypothetical protein